MYEQRKRELAQQKDWELKQRQNALDNDKCYVYYPFWYIQPLLDKRNESRVCDVNAFNSWQSGEITTKECIEQFMSNNHIDQNKRTFEDWEFELWLGSLGYRKATTR